LFRFAERYLLILIDTCAFGVILMDIYRCRSRTSTGGLQM